MKYQLDYNIYTDKVKGCLLGISAAEKETGNSTASDFIKDLADFLLSTGPEFSPEDYDIFMSENPISKKEEYRYASSNHRCGIDSPLSGTFNNICFRENWDCVKRAPVWAAICAGNPKLAAEYAKKDGEYDHGKNAVYAEMFWAAAMAEAFVTDDIEDIINTGMSVLSDKWDIAQIIYDVFMVAENCDTLKHMETTLIRTWGDINPQDVRLNFAYSLLAILYGEGDFDKSFQCIKDLSQTGETVCSLLGTIYGASKLFSETTREINSLSEKISLLAAENITEKNNSAVFVNIPENIYKLSQENYRKRPDKKPLEISVSYEKADNIPALIEGNASCELVIKNTSGKLISGSVSAVAEDEENLSVIFEENMENSIEFEAEAYSEEKIPILVSIKENQDIIWKNNLISVTTETEEETYEKVFGFVGSNHWNIYGPYFGKENTEFLDENSLVSKELPEEYGFKAEFAQNLMTGDMISHITGNSTFYFTKTIVGGETAPAKVSISTTCPIKVWIDGKEVLNSDYTGPWMPDKNIIDLEMEEGEEYRFVIKAIQNTCDFRLSFDLLRNDCEAKENIILDTYGDLI